MSQEFAVDKSKELRGIEIPEILLYQYFPCACSSQNSAQSCNSEFSTSENSWVLEFFLQWLFPSSTSTDCEAVCDI